jgi:iron-sulfur cluster assembly accessory protein
MAITVTEKAASAVKRIIAEQQQAALTPETAEAYKALYAELGRAPYLDEMAAKLGVSEDALKDKLGQHAAAFGKVHLRMRVVGGGCSGFQHKLDLDPEVNPKLDDVFEFHGIPVVVDRRSLMYLDGATVDYHDEMNRPGFSITNPQAKSHCGCGSSFSM